MLAGASAAMSARLCGSPERSLGVGEAAAVGCGAEGEEGRQVVCAAEEVVEGDLAAILAAQEVGGAASGPAGVFYW